MNRIRTIAGGISLAIGMAFASSAVAAPDEGARFSKENVKFFLADPELGLAGVYSADGAEIYFEARRSLDAKSGAPGALSLRLVDAEARTLALGGEPYAKDWVPQQGEFQLKDGFAYAHLLSGLGEALDAADLHVSLSAEKSALADLAMQAADTPAGRFPTRAALSAKKSAPVDASTVADFYLRSVKGVKVNRQRDGMLEAKLGNGIVFQSTQQFIVDEPDAEGRMGRIDAYSMVKAADGYVLGSELGGDHLPKGWSEAMEIVSERSNHAMASDFGRAATALNALAYSGKSTRGVTLSHENEQSAMQRMAQSLSAHLLPERDDDASSSEAMQKAGGRYLTFIQVWRQPLGIGGLAEHSGTRVGKYLYNSTTSTVRWFKGYTGYCNHPETSAGCAGASTMTYKCTYTGPRLTYYRLPSRRPEAFGHTCATGYRLAIGWGHNCHDDSSTQVKAVRGQSYNIRSGSCNNYWAFLRYAPSCGVQ